MYGTIQVKLNVSDRLRDYFVHQCQQANSLSNCVLFEIRQTHFENCERAEFFDKEGLYRSEFKTKRVKASYAELCKQFTENPHYKALGGQCAQQAIKSVVESFNSFNELLTLFFKEEVDKPKMPNYRTKGGLATISYPRQALRFDVETGECFLPISRELKDSLKQDLGLSEIKINGAYGIKVEQISEVRILPKNGELYVEYVYSYGNQGVSCSLELDPRQALGIDPGVSNWLTCVSTRGKSFIVDGLRLKSINQWYNKRIASLKTGKPQNYWDFELAQITEKRNCQIRDALNKAARFIINHCLTNRLGIIVFGWNQSIKDGVELGKQNNQEFVQIPTARLKNRIKELCAVHGIQFVETEESYTSIASFLDNDFLPTYGGEKPAGWKPSGKRVSRGEYKTGDNQLINADCNGAANSLTKVATQLGLVLAEVCRAVLTLPQRYDLFKALSKSYRKQCEAVSVHRTA